MRETPMWGITPVPERLRVLGGVDTTLLWTNLGISLLVLVLPAYFDLSLKKALLATLVGGAIGNGMLALAALIGADARVPTMVLQRAPLVADYTRFSRDRRTAFFGVGIGYFLPTLYQFGFGSILVLSRGVDPNHPELILATIAGGGAAAALALLALTVDETDEAFANVYSCAVSIQNLVPRVSQRALIVAVSALATLGAIAIDMRSYQRFLLLLGAVFVPLLGVLVADWLLAGAHYDEADVFGSRPIRVGPVISWVCGFVAYEWLYQPTGLGFWSRLVAHLPTPSYAIGASVPGFVVSFPP